jgi:type I restriction enzyme, S subunit
VRLGWQRKQLGEIAQVKGGKRVPKGYKLQAEETNHPYIAVSDFSDDGTIDTSGLRYISDEVFAEIERYTISSKDLFISIAGTIGKTGSVPPELDGANLTENACKLVFDPGIYKDFVYYFTKTDDFTRQAEKNTRVAAQPKLALERLKTITLMIPPLPEQKRVVAILDEALEVIAAAAANAETPFKVKQIATTLDHYVYTADDQLIEGEVEEGRRYTEDDFNRVIEIKGARKVPRQIIHGRD